MCREEPLLRGHDHLLCHHPRLRGLQEQRQGVLVCPVLLQGEQHTVATFTGQVRPVLRIRMKKYRIRARFLLLQNRIQILRIRMKKIPDPGAIFVVAKLNPNLAYTQKPSDVL